MGYEAWIVGLAFILATVLQTRAQEKRALDSLQIARPWRLRLSDPVNETTVEANSTDSNSTTYELLTASENQYSINNLECRRYSSSDLYARLEDIGERNQRFMAQTPQEAGKAFDKLMPDSETKQNQGLFDKSSLDPSHCGSKCREITNKLNEAINRDSSLHEGAVGDPGPLEIQEGKTKMLRHSCSLDRFIPVGNCTERGEEEMWGYEKLCSACQGVYMLGAHCFPQFFNAILCDKEDSRCIFDWWTANAHGKCRARTLSFTVMRNIGTADCEDWVFENLHIPVACECYLSKASWLKA